jgi:hypothetical protein
VPRVRCECGNPLTPPKPVTTTPTYTGPQWPDFDPTVIIVIQPTVVIIDTFVLIDIFTGDMFERPPGTDGAEDTIREATVWQLLAEMYAWGGYYEWTTEITMNADGTLSGNVQGSRHWTGNWTTTDTGEQIGTWEFDATFTLAISGTVESTAEGRELHVTVVPTVGATSNWVIVHEGYTEAESQADVTSHLQGWLTDDYPTMNLTAVDYGAVWADFDAPSGGVVRATLTALR